MSKKKLCFLICACIFIFGCNKDSEDQSGQDVSGGENPLGLASPRTGDWNNRTLIGNTYDLGGNISFNFNTDAHTRYLNDPLIFQDIPDGGVPSGATAVVGSDTCYFYPVQNITLNDLNNLPQGELIPFAEVIPLGERLQNGNSQNSWENMFRFQDNLNYFYRTTWNGRQGIVFGADLYGIGRNNQTNRINALLYKNNGHFADFYPVTGYDSINNQILAELGRNGIAFQEVKHTEYHLSLERPDDMIALYMDLLTTDYTNPKRHTILVTTDLAAHANHLVFGRMLQHIEEEFFFPRLKTLTETYISTIEQNRNSIPQDVYTTSLLYFQTAHALLALAPQRLISGDYTRTIEYRDVDSAQILRNYPSQVVQEIEKMIRAEGFSASSIFPGINEDYSQYKVRGHYTKNGVLGAYFRALMWFGRINFNLGSEITETRELARRLAPVALFITDITENSAELKNLWQSLFDPVTELIGASDDISFHELAPLWNRIKGADFNQWYNDPAKREAFISSEYRELRPPSISGSSLFQAPHSGGNSPEDRTIPAGWRLFGQRYTLDSEIHHHLSSPRLYGRQMVSGLDILKVFGSRTADRLLRENDYSRYAGMEERINDLQYNFANLTDDYWASTYYTNVLNQIRMQALFENGTGFYFTEKPGWNFKALNSALGTWAELRHDTILYVKQSYAEMGGGENGMTFRTRPLPEPIHYIEPNVPFWVVSALGIQKMYTVLEKYNFLDAKTTEALRSLHGIFVKAAEISALEAEDREVSREDLLWIGRLPREFARIVLTHVSGGYTDDPDQLRMALVADVFTNAETGVVLETAVGIPYRLYIPLNDGQGGKRIAVGYGFSYYEFTQPMSQRLNNDEWKAIVYRNNSDLRQYLPFWMQNLIQPAR